MASSLLRLVVILRWTWTGFFKIYIFVVLLLASAFLVVKLDKGMRREHLHWVSVAFAVSRGRSLFGTASATRWKWALSLLSLKHAKLIGQGRREYILVVVQGGTLNCEFINFKSRIYLFNVFHLYNNWRGWCEKDRPSLGHGIATGLSCGSSSRLLYSWTVIIIKFH